MKMSRYINTNMKNLTKLTRALIGRENAFAGRHYGLRRLSELILFLFRKILRVAGHCFAD